MTSESGVLIVVKKKVKNKSKKTEVLTSSQIDVLEAQEKVKRAEEKKIDDFKREQKMRSDYEKQKAELAPWIGYDEYRAARSSENRIKAIGIIGAIMRGEKRTTIRQKWKISSNKLNAILNSQMVDDVLSYSLGNIYSFQTACVQAILWELKNNHDGRLAVVLLDKLGLFTRAQALIPQTTPEIGDGKEENVEDVVGFLFSRGDTVQAGQAREAFSRLVVDSLKSKAPK
jgi:hypothetical protein